MPTEEELMDENNEIDTEKIDADRKLEDHERSYQNEIFHE